MLKMYYFSGLLSQACFWDVTQHVCVVCVCVCVYVRVCVCIFNEPLYNSEMYWFLSTSSQCGNKGSQGSELLVSVLCFPHSIIKKRFLCSLGTRYMMPQERPKQSSLLILRTKPVPHGRERGSSTERSTFKIHHHLTLSINFQMKKVSICIFQRKKKTVHECHHISQNCFSLTFC